MPQLALALVVYSIVARAVKAAVVGKFVVEERHLMRTTLLYPLRDLLGFFYWAASYASSKILWRGRVYRLTDGGLMLASELKSGQLVRRSAGKAVS
jgi:ceramide glucosyltransferase